MNNMVFSTRGDWDTTSLYNNGQEVMAAELLVQLQSGRDEFGNVDRGGIRDGGEITAIVRPQDNPQSEVGIFPGRLEMNFPGHQIIIENNQPGFAFEFTRVWYNGQDVTNNVIEVYVDINAVDNIVKAYATIYKPHWLGADEVASFNILG